MPAAVFLPIAIAASAAAVGGATMYSAKQERKSAEKAVESQERIAAQQIEVAKENTAAVKESEVVAQETAKTQLKAARARKTQTILTTPLGASVDEEQINRNTILGVPS